MKKSITYFEESGVQNTDEIIGLVDSRLKEGDIKNVVIASSTGKTGLKFAKVLANKTNLVIVSLKPGYKTPSWEFDLGILKELEGLGVEVVKATHALSGVERSFTKRFYAPSYSEFLAEILRTLFGQGTKVAVECTIMSADAGLISNDKTIAVGGTGAKGRGADTAIVVLPSYSDNFFDFRILEVVAKPFNVDYKVN